MSAFPAGPRMLANARMYSVTPSAAEAWRAVIAWAARAARLPIAFIEHAPPRPISELWARGDLGLVQMCGLPAARRAPAPTLVAAPVPSPPRYGGKAVYMSDLAVRADSPFRTLEDTFGGVAGYTVKDSQSGYFAFRSLLLSRYPQARYRKVVGDLITPRGVMRALANGDIDVGPLDGYVLDLLRAGDPALASGIRVVASTDPTPIPPLVATASLEERQLEALREAFLHAHEERSLPLQDILVARFVVPQPSGYDELRRRAGELEEAEPWP